MRGAEDEKQFRAPRPTFATDNTRLHPTVAAADMCDHALIDNIISLVSISKINFGYQMDVGMDIGLVIMTYTAHTGQWSQIYTMHGKVATAHRRQVYKPVRQSPTVGTDYRSHGCIT